MLQQPHQFGGLPVGDIGHTGLHFGHGLGVGHGASRNPPFDLAAAGGPREGRQIKALAVINHWLTITWSGGTRQFSPPFGGSVVATLDKVSVDLMVVLGTTTMPIHQVMRLSRGAIIELDATEADEVKILANNLPVASGVVLVDRNRIAVEVKQMLPKSPDVR